MTARERRFRGKISPRSYVALGLLAVISTAARGAAPTGGIEDVKVTTSTSIDCSSLQSIARDLYRDCETDEEKAIATWYFVRRTMFHWPHVPTWDVLDLINSYGWGLCGYQSHAFAEICNAGGLKARLVHAKNHVIAEAWYDDAWHIYDCQVGWFAYRKDRSAVASCAEMKADNTIITEARADGRTSKPWFQCSDSHGIGIQTVNTHRARGIPKVPTRRLVIGLRRGESIRRSWGNEGKSWHKDGETRWTQPAHGCTRQSVDANDPVNWPHWKPYAKVSKVVGDRTIYNEKRYFGNGRMVYAPDLATDAFRDGLAPDGLVSIRANRRRGDGPRLYPALVGEDSRVTFVVRSPYVMVDAWLDARALRRTGGDVLAVHARGPKGDWREVYRAQQTGPLALEEVSLKAAAWASKEYFVRFEMRAGSRATDVGLDSLTITTVFMNNMYALPHLAPGTNVIRVDAADGADLRANRLTLEYAWIEQGRTRTLRRRIDRIPFECTVDVGGDEMPRMKHVEMLVEP